MAVDTTRARIGALVTCNSYRNPHLLADMSRTIDHLSGGRFTLRIGSGWAERDYVEYGYEYGTPVSRLQDLATALPVIRKRLDALNPPPVQARLPILIGGQGEKVTLRLVAQHADAWNGMGSPDELAHKHAVIDRWCAEIGRDPSEIERTAVGFDDIVDQIAAYAEAGTSHLILMVPAPMTCRPSSGRSPSDPPRSVRRWHSWGTPGRARAGRPPPVRERRLVPAVPCRVSLGLRNRASGNDPVHRLAGRFGDVVEVCVVVQQGCPGRLRARGDQEVGDAHRSQSAAAPQDALHLDRTRLDRRRDVDVLQRSELGLDLVPLCTVPRAVEDFEATHHARHQPQRRDLSKSSGDSIGRGAARRAPVEQVLRR